MDGWMDGDGWRDGWMNGWTRQQIDNMALAILINYMGIALLPSAFSWAPDSTNSCMDL